MLFALFLFHHAEFWGWYSITTSSDLTNQRASAVGIFPYDTYSMWSLKYSLIFVVILFFVWLVVLPLGISRLWAAKAETFSCVTIWTCFQMPIFWCILLCYMAAQLVPVFTTQNNDLDFESMLLCDASINYFLVSVCFPGLLLSMKANRS